MGQFLTVPVLKGLTTIQSREYEYIRDLNTSIKFLRNIY